MSWWLTRHAPDQAEGVFPPLKLTIYRVSINFWRNASDKAAGGAGFVWKLSWAK